MPEISRLPGNRAYKKYVTIIKITLMVKLEDLFFDILAKAWPFFISNLFFVFGFLIFCACIIDVCLGRLAFLRSYYTHTALRCVYRKDKPLLFWVVVLLNLGLAIMFFAAGIFHLP